MMSVLTEPVKLSSDLLHLICKGALFASKGLCDLPV